MTTPIWMIGDVQGCCTPLEELLALPGLLNDPTARFWFAGDLINRGPASLDTLRRIINLGDRAISVLGNHDLHLLAAYAGIRKLGKSDTLDDILAAPDRDDLIDWLRHRPLAHFDAGHLMVHAGVLAPWDLDMALTLAEEVQAALRGRHWRSALHKMYGNEPTYWKNSYTGGKRLRVIINAFTRMRLCKKSGHMDFDAKVMPGAPPAGLIPWFDVPHRATQDVPIVFGHWSTLGLIMRADAVCLDTGCVWGGKLTAMRLHDRHIVQVSCNDTHVPDKN
jgi:bis(5'-nucleosyl)-tetraphosphatase (symmetrical)